MSDELLDDTAEELFEDAPCGYLTTRLDGTIVKVNRTFESWTGLRREDLLGTRFHDLLAPGGSAFYETRVVPLLHLQGAVQEVAVEVRRPGGPPLPALLNAVVRTDAEGAPRLVRTTVFDATDRRRYERELVAARRREQDIASELQRSLLAGARPEHPGLDLDVAYRPAVRGLEVGGDWHDAFWLEEGDRVGLVVGDVVGRGIGAATTMGQLRSAVRALASTGLAPGALLVALDRYARRHRVGRMTTLVYAELDVGSGAVSYACAGHLPPVVARPGEAPQLLWDGRSPPLDAHRTSGRPRDEGTCALPPGGLLLLYTDGLVERRDAPINERMDVLLDEVAAHREERAGLLTASLVRALHDPGGSDDVCLLAARRAESPA